MFDPMTLLLVGAGAVAFRELNRKDYGILTASRDERYRTAMAECHDPQSLLAESRLFADHGLKAQAAMLKRRAEWRSRPDATKKAHEEVFQKAMRSRNIPAILEVADSFENWTATKKASALREHARLVQEQMLVESLNTSSSSDSQEKPSEQPHTGLNGGMPQNTPLTSESSAEQKD